MATAQKRGFRLPWGSEPRNDEPSTDDAPAGKPADGVEGSNDLGSGPFGLAAVTDGLPTGALAQPSAVAAPDGPTADEVAGVIKRSSWPANDRRTAGPLSSGATLASLARAAAAAISPPEEPAAIEAPVEAPSQADTATTGAMAPDAVPAAVTATDAAAAHATTGESATVDTTAVEDAPIASAAEQPEQEEIEVVTEARLEAALTAAPPARTERAAALPARPIAGARPAPTAGPRRDNPLVAGLVRAMHDAAATARDEVVATFRADAAARAEAIRGESAATTEELKKAADADVTGIKDWSRAELARVREETERRIADRKTQLVEETEFEATGLQERLADLQATVEGFESDMAAFFEALLAEGDPARVAGLAERMPSPPALGGGTEAFEAAPTFETEAETEAEAETDEPTRAATRSRSARRGQVDEAAPESEASDDQSAATDEPASESLDPNAAAAAEAEARVGLDVQTQLLVSGLSSVASIATFKAALVHVAGISAVSVTAGEDGEVLYTVTQDGTVDIREALRAIPAFDARIIADDGTTLIVTAREPEA